MIQPRSTRGLSEPMNFPRFFFLSVFFLIFLFWKWFCGHLTPKSCQHDFKMGEGCKGEFINIKKNFLHYIYESMRWFPLDFKLEFFDGRCNRESLFFL